MAWKLTQCPWREKARLDAYLKDDWEPFAVTETDAFPTIWLRRSAARKDAGVAELPKDGPPPRPRLEPEVDR